MVKALFDEKTDNSVGVEDEVSTVRVPITDFAVLRESEHEVIPRCQAKAVGPRNSPEKSNQLRGLRENSDGLKGDLCRDGGLGLLAGGAVVRTYALERARLGLLDRDRHFWSEREGGVMGRGVERGVLVGNLVEGPCENSVYFRNKLFTWDGI